jgi:lactate dehydrogenase-like 2-hydroxyacid dehydrogenase
LVKNKIVSFLSNSPDTLIQQYKDLPDPPTVEALGTRGQVSEDEACESLKDATVVLTFPASPYMNRRMLESCKNVKLIQFATVGYDNIDLKTATELGIPVANNPGWNSISVAEHALMLMLMTLKKVNAAREKTLNTGWTMSETRAFWGKVWELSGKTVGIIGLGSIGRELVRLLKPFNVKILYYKRTRLSTKYEEELDVQYREFKTLLNESDIVTIHTPLTEETRGLFNKNTIEQMKQNSILINTARHEIVEEEAVVEALGSGRLVSYGTDFVKMKSVDGVSTIDSPLVEMDSVVFTPHIAGATREAVGRSRRQYMENVKRFLSGKNPEFIIN